MNIFFLLSLLFLIACNNPNSNKKSSDLKGIQRVDTIENHMQNKDFEDVLKLNLEEAINKYGQPVLQENFIMDDLQGEFRNNISDKYSLEERMKKNIKINEVTWEKDNETNITVWYQKTDQEYLPKATLIWDKDSEF